MPKNVSELDRMKGEVLDYLRIPARPSFMALDCPARMASSIGTPNSIPNGVNSSTWLARRERACSNSVRRALDEDELDGASETLEDVEMPDVARRDAAEFITSLRPQVGRIAWVRIAWQHEGRRYAYERVAPWYERFLDLLDELGGLPSRTERSRRRRK